MSKRGCSIMKRRKYLFSEKTAKKLMKLRVKQYNKQDLKNYRLRKFAEFVSIVLAVILMSIFTFLVISLFSLNGMNEFIGGFLIILAIILSMIPASIIIGVPFSKIITKIPYKPLPRITREMVMKSNKRVIKYYKIPEDFRITKCYECTNELLNKKDVILFLVKGKLRITNDFTTSTKDFGCYEFSEEEIELYYDERDLLTTTVLKTNEITFVLGKRAKPFIVKGFEFIKDKGEKL